MRRRRSLLLAGGCSRGAGATPGRRADGIVARRASLAGGTSPPGKGVWVSSFPGVGGAPRHQPPANKREHLRRTKCAPRNGHHGRCSATASAHQPASGARNALRAIAIRDRVNVTAVASMWPDTAQLPSRGVFGAHRRTGESVGGQWWAVWAWVRTGWAEGTRGARWGGAPEALSMVSRGLQPRSGCYPR